MGGQFNAELGGQFKRNIHPDPVAEIKRAFFLPMDRSC